MNHSDKIIACQKIHEKANFFRGLFLNRVAVIDSKISTILADYFCPNDPQKRKLLRNKVLSNSIQKREASFLRSLKMTIRITGKKIKSISNLLKKLSNLETSLLIPLWTYQKMP